MTARRLSPFNIDVAHKPTHKHRLYFTKHKLKTKQDACGGVYTGLKTQHQLYVGLWAFPQASGTND